MKRGRFFSIPEGPGDVETLRGTGRSLDPSTRPRWLRAEDQGEYRFLGRHSLHGLDAGARSDFAAETAELQAVGLLIEKDAEDPDGRLLYVPSRAGYSVWSIGILAGASPWELHPAPGAVNPALTRDHVSDVPASFVADPFMVRDAGTWFLFFELFNWRANKGEIGLATSRDGLEWSYQQRVLIEPFHLSYPYLFTVGDEHYMIPESRQSGSVRLYRAVRFPWEWALDTVLLEDVALVDASIFRRGARWWMLAGADSVGRHDTLRLFGAETLRGPWREHPRSPIVSGDPTSARPAGTVIRAGRRQFRLSQSCHPEYGLEVRAFAIAELTRETYRETPWVGNPVLSAAGAGWNARGMHHLDAHRLLPGRWLACVDGWADPHGEAPGR